MTVKECPRVYVEIDGYVYLAPELVIQRLNRSDYALSQWVANIREGTDKAERFGVRKLKKKAQKKDVEEE